MELRHAILLALVAIGCRQQGTPLANPFLAPDRVPPPGTRAPAPGTALPYYGSELPPAGVAPASGTSAPASPWRVGQSGSSGGAIDLDAIADADKKGRVARDRTRWAALEAPDDEIAIPQDNEQGVQSRATASTARGQSLTQRGRSNEDAFRPPSEGSRSNRHGEVIRASYEVAADDEDTGTSPGGQPATNPLRPRSAQYAFAPDYSWLQGRLEHSEASGQWKLRYIPIDGTTDKYGGSVIVDNPQALGDLASGDYVRIRGELLEGERDGVTFAPVYRIVATQAVAD
jgi:hypothetical protein